MNAPHRPIDFWFDFSSPYSYIASEWIEALAARHGRTVEWHAMLLGATFQVTSIQSPVSYPLKREYSLLDFERSARYAGVPFRMPARFPIATQNAARIYWWLADTDPARAVGWARHCLRAEFARGVDVGDAASLQALAAEFDIAPARAEAVWSDPVWKARLKAVNDEAIARGVFGAPYFVVDGEPFWGNDRRAQIERWLERGPF
jgi:2-hydroxychromene-2-carboxylate isomerase